MKNGMKGANKMSSSGSSTNVREVIGSGVFPEPEPRVFKPIKLFQFKLYIHVFLVFVIITIIISIFVFLLGFLGDEPPLLEIAGSLGMTLDQLYGVLIIGYLFISIIWVVPCLILIPIYIRSFKYVVHGTEVVVHKGLINKSEKHVPFRTITHISSRAGIFDRLFGIGTVEIQTAGGSGASTAPEEKIEGIRVYREVRDFILNQLRNLKPQQFAIPGVELTTGQAGKGQEAIESRFLVEMLEILMDIKDNLAEE
jgi:membrane protein YdbS with pleckstrin-like domain